MTFGAVKATLLGPAAVAIHDDGDMRGDAGGVDAFGQMVHYRVWD